MATCRRPDRPTASGSGVIVSAAMSAPIPEAAPRYSAFISYSHRDERCVRLAAKSAGNLSRAVVLWSRQSARWIVVGPGSHRGASVSLESPLISAIITFSNAPSASPVGSCWPTRTAICDTRKCDTTRPWSCWFEKATRRRRATAPQGSVPTWRTSIGRSAGQARRSCVDEPEDKPWGDRVAVVTDPDGYRWVLATFKKLAPLLLMKTLSCRLMPAAATSGPRA
jgi:hypothetical protein